MPAKRDDSSDSHAPIANDPEPEQPAAPTGYTVLHTAIGQQYRQGDFIPADALDEEQVARLTDLGAIEVRQ